MDIILGSPAVSSFRIEKITESLAKEGIRISSIATHFVHLVDTKEALNDEEKTVLNKILSYGPSRTEGKDEGELFFVIPRVGTISPWASKATDIAKNCGLCKILRIERGVAYYIAKEGGVFTEEEKKVVAMATVKKLADIESREYGMILRAKGMVPDASGQWHEFDLTPGEYEIRESSADYTGRLCVSVI